MRESLVQSAVFKALDKKGIYYVKVIVANKAGGADTYACIMGDFFALEFKGTGGTLSDLQKYKREKIKKNGGTYLLITPENYKRIISIINNLQINLK